MAPETGCTGASTSWPSGVGGVQCAACSRTAVCRAFPTMPEADDSESEWLCMPCYFGDES